MNGRPRSFRFSHRAHGQIVPLFALGLIGFTALIGVILDGGTLYVQRRTAQNAADAAALAGARALQQATISPVGAVPAEICKYVLANNFGVTPSVTAFFVDVNGVKVPSSDIFSVPTNCTGSFLPPAILTGSAGVHVDVTFGPYDTYLAGIVGIHKLSAIADATAQVWNFAIDAAYVAPWAVCGPTAPTSTTPTFAELLDPATGYTTILASAIAAHISVILEGSKVNSGATGWLGPPPACPDDTGSSWKGKIDPPPGNIIPPVNVPTAHGNGTVSTQCTLTGQTNPTAAGQCFLFVPVTDAHNTPGEAHVVTFACMDVYPGHPGLDEWWGTLETITTCPNYPYKPLWQFGQSNGSTVVALTL